MKKENLSALLESNPYPGRGIVLGKSGESAVAVYFIMGRSENSRNRVFVPTEDGIRTQAHDPSKMTDPSLIIYHPVREAGRGLIVTNGDQTDTIRDYIFRGRTFAEALKSRTFEPDGPNWTPRISGLLSPDGSFQLSILKSADGNPDCCCRYFLFPARAALFTPTPAMGTLCPPSRGSRSGWLWRRIRRRRLRTGCGPPWTRTTRCPCLSALSRWRTEPAGRPSATGIEAPGRAALDRAALSIPDRQNTQSRPMNPVPFV